MRSLVAIAAAILWGASASAAQQPAHPEWHVTRHDDAFENHMTVGGRGDSGKDYIVAMCDDDRGLGFFMQLDGVASRNGGPNDGSRAVILKGATGDAPIRLDGDQKDDMIFVSDAAQAAKIFADNRVVGARVKFPDGTDHDDWFVFSKMDAPTRQALLSCAASH